MEPKSPAWHRALLVAASWIGAFSLTHWPEQDYSSEPPGYWGARLDKGLHFGLYAALSAITCCAALSVLGRRLGYAWACVALILAYAVFDEATQPWFGRYADVWDWVADAVGACAGCAVTSFFINRRELTWPANRGPKDSGIQGSGRPSDASYRSANEL